MHPDNTATLFTGKVETGTGVQTALAQIAAEELDFPFDRLDVVMGTTSETVDQGPSYGSMTVRYAGPQIRHAAAAGRQALLDLAAAHFGVPANQLRRRGRHDLGHRLARPHDHLRQAGGRQAARTWRSARAASAFDMKVAPDVRTQGPVHVHRRRPAGAAQGHSRQDHWRSSPMSRTSG